MIPATIKKGFVSVVLTGVLITLTAAQTTFPAPHDTRAFFLKNVGIAFSVPKQYSILLQETYEPRYAVTILFGEEIRPNHLKGLDLSLSFFPGAHDGRRYVPNHTPSQYIDVEYRRVIKEDPDNDIEYIKLFGNKAIRYTTEDLGCCVKAIGFLKPSQLSGKAATYRNEYLVRITTSGFDDDLDLFNRLIKSLRVVR